MSKSDKWLKRPQPRPDAPIRLFCLPFAGGNSSSYWSWSDRLPPHIELCLIELPGRQSRIYEPAHDQVYPLVEAVHGALSSEFGGQFALFGHSYGALLAFELTRLHQRVNARLPLRLFVSGFRAPYLERRDPPTHALSGRKFIETIAERYGTIEETILQDEELLALIEPTLRADMAACETYEFCVDEPLVCPISALWACDDPAVEKSDLAAWSTLTSGSFTLREFSGGHFFIHEHSDHLLNYIASELATQSK